MKRYVILLTLLGSFIQVLGHTLVPKECHDQYPTDAHTSGAELTYNEKCLLKCALQSHDVVDSNGEIDVEKSKEFAKEVAPPDQLEHELQSFEPCKAQAQNDDLCEKIGIYMVCLGNDVIDRYLAS